MGDVYPPWLSFLDDVIRFHVDDSELNDDDDVIARVVGMITLNAAKRAAIQCVYSHDENRPGPERHIPAFFNA